MLGPTYFGRSYFGASYFGPDAPTAGENRPPVAAGDAVTVVRNQSFTFDPRANDSDPDGDRLGVVAVTQAAQGAVTLRPDGLLTYKPGAGFVGADSFTYTVGDGRGGTATATVSVQVVKK